MLDEQTSAVEPTVFAAQEKARSLAQLREAALAAHHQECTEEEIEAAIKGALRGKAEPARGKGRKRKRRIVTKEQYARSVGKRVALSSLGGLFVLLGLGGAALFGFLLLIVIFGHSYYPQLQNIPNLGITEAVFASFTIISLGASWMGFDTVRRTIQSEPIQPLTRQNIGDLPAEQSLVRASEEPPAQSQATLLRAAAGQEETPEEQLLRPH